MKRIRILLSLFFLISSVTTLANTNIVNLFAHSNQFSPQIYTCGNPPKKNNDNFLWCNCYSIYMIDTCKNNDGGDQCNDKFIRKMIKEFGGPKTVCYTGFSHDMSIHMCITTLSYYLNKCPIKFR